MTSVLESMIRSAAEVENTPELRKYWERRYREAQEKNLFRISDKTLDLLSAPKPVSKPATTYADIFLLSHIDAQNKLQENLLQDTIETLVRLLDALLEKINFTPEAVSMISQYRKIAIGIADLDNYITRIGFETKPEAIDYIGKFISTKAYRASESLAEEKGPCLSWQKIKQHLRPKSFEFWYNRENGEIKNGLDLSQIFSEESILESSFEIIPRRNSSLLLFPQTEEWLAWTDRDPSTPKTPMKLSTSQTTQEKVESTEENLAITMPTENISEAEQMFQLGELVQIQKTEDPRHEDILQVVELIERQGKHLYRLSDGQKETEERLWEEGDLSIVELGELLDIINSAKKSRSDQKHSMIENWSRALVVDTSTNLVLVEKSEQAVNLPGIQIQKNQVPEKILLRFLAETYKYAGDIQEEIGSALNISENVGIPSQLNLGFTVDPKGILESDKHTWLPLNSQELPKYALVLLEKSLQRQNLIQDIKDQLQMAVEEKRYLEANISQANRQEPEATKFSSTTSQRDYKPEILAKALGSLSKYVLKLEQLIQTDDFGEMLLSLTYDAHGPRIVSLQGKALPKDLQQTLELFLELINFILTNDIHPRFISEKLAFKESDHINLPVKKLLQFIGDSLKMAPDRVQEIDETLVEEIEPENLNKIKKRDTI